MDIRYFFNVCIGFIKKKIEDVFSLNFWQMYQFSLNFFFHFTKKNFLKTDKSVIFLPKSFLLNFDNKKKYEIYVIKKSRLCKENRLIKKVIYLFEINLFDN